MLTFVNDTLFVCVFCWISMACFNHGGKAHNGNTFQNYYSSSNIFY